MVRRIFGLPSHHFLCLFLVGLATVRLAYAASVTGHGSPSVASPTSRNAVPVANNGRGIPSVPIPISINPVAAAPTDSRGNPSVLSSTPSAGNTWPLAPPKTMSASTNNLGALRTPDYCNLMPYTGICRAYLPSWFYNITTGICELFVRK
ncbi:hypothetical protein RvY_17186-2 [Ramazzottius varieornatus]|uniref:BPTI/Kunitz inhibitor domain-containing protein n=1 Tax=Ramazzottius varieornatus TaxID=947166 RepID=A0A1D1W263_RAMVA|nr:hypothetical protein RvY_17186-2 [Ramazzottius varieornatus]